MTEAWKPTADNPAYEVSSLGNVRSPRGVILKPGRNGTYGYMFVHLGAGMRRYVHRLVADAFVAPVAGMDVDHIDGDTSNNAVTNLRVVTHAENMRLQRERKPLCKRGHAYAEHGGWSTDGRRFCRECRRAWDRKRNRDRRKTGRAS